MDKRQEEKFEKWNDDNRAWLMTKPKHWPTNEENLKNCWQACLSANGIEEKQEWTPREGEAVFIFTGRDNRIPVGRFVGYEKDGRMKVITTSGDCARTNRLSVKPFNPSSIGKPWSEI